MKTHPGPVLVAQLIEGFPSVHKALGSIPSTTQNMCVVIPALKKWRQEDQKFKDLGPIFFKEKRKENLKTGGHICHPRALR